MAPKKVGLRAGVARASLGRARIRTQLLWMLLRPCSNHCPTLPLRTRLETVELVGSAPAWMRAAKTVFRWTILGKDCPPSGPLHLVYPMPEILSLIYPGLPPVQPPVSAQLPAHQ